MKCEPCAFCGLDEPHQPYEDGLIECRNRLASALADALDRERELKAALNEAARQVGEQRLRAEDAERQAKRLASEDADHA